MLHQSFAGNQPSLDYIFHECHLPSIVLSTNSGRCQPRRKSTILKNMANRLTEEQKEEISAAFKLFDKNGNGHISVAELGEAMKQAGQHLSEGEIKDMIKAVDRSGNGMVEYAEFEDLMASQMEDPLGADDLKYYFKKFDPNGDGFITGDELALVMKTFGGKTYSKEEIDDTIKTADINADGKVSYDEFVAMMK